MDKTIQAGFAKSSLTAAIITGRPCIDRVDITVMIIKSNTDIGCIVVADVINFHVQPSRKIRKEIAAALAIPVEKVALYCTHTHTLRPRDLDMNMVSEIVCRTAKQAASQCQDVEFARSTIKADIFPVYRRRAHLNDLGAFTCWYGHRDMGDGRADVSHLVKQSLTSLAHGEAGYNTCCFNLPQGYTDKDFMVDEAPLPVPQPLPLPKAADNLLQGIFFRSCRDGSPLGSLLRFPSHAATAGGGKGHSGDYPAYFKQAVEDHWGGTALFVPGPCGNQVCLVEQKSPELAKKYGTKLADITLSSIDGLFWEQEGTIAVSSPILPLVMNPIWLLPHQSAAEQRDKLLLQLKELATQNPVPLVKMIKIRDACNELHSVAVDWYELPQQKNFEFPASVIQIGSSVICGIPGEPFAEYGQRLRDETIGERVIVTELVNGKIGYLPTKKEHALGSYEATRLPFGVETENIIIETLKKEIMKKDFGG